MSSEDISFIPDWRARLLAALYAQFKFLPYWKAYASALGAMAQSMEDTLWSLVADCSLDVASGAQLDQWGDLVGLPRNGLNDADYRRFINAQIPVLRCGGTGDELIEIFAMCCGVPVAQVQLFLQAPAAYEIIVNDAAPLVNPVRSAVIRAMLQAQSTGIGMVMIEAQPGYFGWDEDPDALGFDDGEFAAELD